MLTITVKTIRMAPYVIVCSMQHVLTVSTYPGSCKTCLFCMPGFGLKVSFISNHWPKKWPTTHLHISLFDLVNPLIFANSYPGWHNYSLWGLLFQFSQSVGQLALKFHWVKTYRQCQHTNYIEITQSELIKKHDLFSSGGVKKHEIFAVVFSDHLSCSCILCNNKG